MINLRLELVKIVACRLVGFQNAGTPRPTTRLSTLAANLSAKFVVNNR